MGIKQKIQWKCELYLTPEFFTKKPVINRRTAKAKQSNLLFDNPKNIVDQLVYHDSSFRPISKPLQSVSAMGSPCSVQIRVKECERDSTTA